MENSSLLKTEIAGIKMNTPIFTASGTFGFGKEFADFLDLSKLQTGLHPDLSGMFAATAGDAENIEGTIKQIDISGFTEDSIPDAEYKAVRMFSGCSSLERI